MLLINFDVLYDIISKKKRKANQLSISSDDDIEGERFLKIPTGLTKSA